MTTLNNDTNVDQISNNANSNPPLNNMPLPINQSSIIIDHFSQLKEELKISLSLSQASYEKWLTAHKTVQEQTGKFIEMQYHMH